jgi:membrane-associated phospholipid phosphatase
MPPDLSALPLAALDGFEREVTHALNCKLTSPFFDAVLPTVMDKEVAVPVFLLVLVVSAFVRRRRALRAVLTAAAAYGICMGIATLMWQGIGRPRPWREMTPVLRTEAEIATCADHPDSIVGRGHLSVRPGFPSRHALTSAVFATSLLGIARWLGLVAWVFALLVALARVYAGVHWPSDVLAGLVIGGLSAWGIWRILPSILALGGHRHWIEAPVAASEVEDAEAGGREGASG